MEGGARLPGQCRRAALPWAGGGDGDLGKGGQWWPPGTAPGGVKAQSGPASSVSLEMMGRPQCPWHCRGLHIPGGTRRQEQPVAFGGPR